MLFLPISSRISIMLYDSEVYSIRSRDRRSEFITIARDDEERLNKLQMVGDRGVLYLPRPDRYPEVKALAREVRSAYPCAARDFGVYGSRDSTPDAGQRMLLNAHSWNSMRYTDDEGGVSYLRKHL